MKYLFALLIALTLTSVQAADNEIKLTTLNQSWHFSRENQNENHKGVGLEYHFEDKHLGLITFTNSHNDSSVVAYIGEEYFEIHDIHLGLIAGAATGYDDLQEVAGVTARYKYFRFIVTPVLLAAGFVFPLN